MAKSNISFHWNASEQQIIANKGFGRRLNRALAEILLSHMEKYTPYDPKRTDGIHMVDNVTLVNIQDNNNSVGIQYNSPYTRKQYYNLNHPASDHSPLATDHWDEYCWELEKAEITQETDEVRKRYAK